jgi:nucleotidyltransferase substrate binding protein (TIGR01987 family)
LKEALKFPRETDLLKAGCIQYFEFTFELAWKSIKRLMQENGNECQSPKECLKLAFREAWIDNEEVWLSMLASRNRMSHTYNADSALVVYDKLPSFCDELDKLYNILCRERRQ